MENKSINQPSSPTLANNITYNERVHYYKEALKPNVIDLSIIQHLGEQGLPESHGLRSQYWKILLRYLPVDRTKWDDFLNNSRKAYKDFVDELMIDPYKYEKEKEMEREREVFEHSDHPLNNNHDSKWNEYFKDQAILVDIEKDVRRTFPSLHFFNHNSQDGKTSIHYEALRRILFIYAKLNPGIKYVQGMNEILGPIYYIFAIDPDETCKVNAESDAFYCFTNLMSEIRDNFCKTLDRSDTGVLSSIKKLNRILRQNDRQLWDDLEEKKLNPQFYSFRWITLLLSQEFELPDVLRLWDSLFSDSNRFDFLYYFCCAMLICVRESILKLTFAESLKLLQSYPNNIDFHSIYSTALSIKNGTFKLNTENVLDSGQSYLRLFNPFVSISNNNTTNNTSYTSNNNNGNVNNINNSNNTENVQQQQQSSSSPWNYKSFFTKYFDSSNNNSNNK